LFIGGDARSDEQLQNCLNSFRLLEPPHRHRLTTYILRVFLSPLSQLAFVSLRLCSQQRACLPGPEASWQLGVCG
jgi:hypothetical protein